MEFIMVFYSIITSPIYFFYASYKGHGLMEMNTWIGLLMVIFFAFILGFVVDQIEYTAERSYMKVSNIDPINLAFFTSIIFTGLSIVSGVYALEFLINSKFL